MIIRLVSVRFAPAQFAAVRSFAQERLAPTLGALPGFGSYVAGLDEASGQFLGVSVWDTEEQAHSADEAVARLRAEFSSAIEATGAPRPGQSDERLPRRYEVIARA